MAASAVVAGPAPERMAAWSRFRSVAQQRIHEGNAVAGERMWALTHEDARIPCFTIGCTLSGDNYVECSLDVETWLLTCKPGPAGGNSALIFEILAGSSAALRHAGRDRSVEEAVTLILNELVRLAGGEEENRSS